MGTKKPLTGRGAQRMREREASVGLEADDDAARWLAEHDKPAPPDSPKARRSR